jgi:dTDP-glucose 4,6-dehydratase
LVSNCSNNYGPYQFPEKLIPLMVLSGLAAKPLPVYGQGLNIRDWLHVDDHVAALRRIVDRGRIGETYLIGARAEARNIDLVHAICRLLDQRRPQGAPHARLISLVTDRPGHDARYAIDPSKIEGELEWRPRYDLDRGLASTVDWYISNQEWCQRASATYRQERLGVLVPTEAA